MSTVADEVLAAELKALRRGEGLGRPGLGKIAFVNTCPGVVARFEETGYPDPQSRAYEWLLGISEPDSAFLPLEEDRPISELGPQLSWAVAIAHPSICWADGIVSWSEGWEVTLSARRSALAKAYTGVPKTVSNREDEFIEELVERLGSLPGPPEDVPPTPPDPGRRRRTGGRMTGIRPVIYGVMLVAFIVAAVFLRPTSASKPPSPITLPSIAWEEPLRFDEVLTAGRFLQAFEFDGLPAILVDDSGPIVLGDAVYHLDVEIPEISSGGLTATGRTLIALEPHSQLEWTVDDSAGNPLDTTATIGFRSGEPEAFDLVASSEVLVAGYEASTDTLWLRDRSRLGSWSVTQGVDGGVELLVTPEQVRLLRRTQEGVALSSIPFSAVSGVGEAREFGVSGDLLAATASFDDRLVALTRSSSEIEAWAGAGPLDRIFSATVVADGDSRLPVEVESVTASSGGVLLHIRTAVDGPESASAFILLDWSGNLVHAGTTEILGVVQASSYDPQQRTLTVASIDGDEEDSTQVLKASIP